MPELPLASARGRPDTASDSEQLAECNDTAKFHAEDGSILSVEQVRFAAVLGEALVGAWRRESAPTAE